MPGFNDQQRERGCILAVVERGERSAETGGGRRKRKERDRQITPGVKRKQEGQELRRVSLSEASRGSEDSAGTTHGVRYWRTLSHY